jgi:hypothetical protein
LLFFRLDFQKEIGPICTTLKNAQPLDSDKVDAVMLLLAIRIASPHIYWITATEVIFFIYIFYSLSG